MAKENQPNQKPTLFFVNKEKEPLFSKKNRALLSDPMDDNNPITVQVLGICSIKACYRNEYFGNGGNGSIKCDHLALTQSDP